MSKSCKFFKPRAMSRIWNDLIKGDNECGVKTLTNVTIWFLLHKMSLDIFVRSPLAASGETRMRRTSSKSTSIEIEKPWRGHNFGWPETVFQARNSRVNDWGKKERSSNSRFHQKNKACHTLTGSSIILLLPDLSLKVSDGEMLALGLSSRNMFS